MLAILGNHVIEWSSTLEYIQENRENWIEVVGEEIDFLDWDALFSKG